MNLSYSSPSTADLSLQQLALHLDAHVTEQFMATARRLDAEGVPASLIGTTMLRLAMQTIYAADGAKQLRDATAEWLHVISAPRV